MPKSTDKTKGTQKRKSAKKSNCNDVNNTESDGSESKPVAKKKKVAKRSNILEGISMSKDLAQKVRQRRGTRGSRGKSNNTNNEPRLCGNGKPMPSLAELEAMYRDSDDENTTDLAPVAITNIVERSETPVKPIIVNEEALNSPTGLKQIATQVIDLITKKIENVENVPPPPVIPPKKRKKPEQPYIVGCKDRQQVPWAPKTKFAVGDEEYGVDKNENDEDDLPKKRKKRGKKINLSKSIFNAKTDDIAERLLEAERTDGLLRSSTDSDDTVTYAFPGSSPNRSAFSPLPSTSKDQETFLKNDKLFNDSLKNESFSDENHNDIEVIEVPYDTITIDDTMNDTNPNNEPKYNIDDDSCVIVDETPTISRTTASTQESPVRDDFYSSIDLTQFDSEVYEIEDDEDIESVIAENKAILEKHNKKNRMDLMTTVDTSINDVEFFGNTSDVSVPIETPSNEPTTEQSTSQGDSLPTEPAIPIESTSNPTNEIETIVTDFFNQPQEISNAQSTNDTSVIDLTNCQDTILNRISSFMSSIESLFRGRNTPRRNNRDNGIVVVDDVTSSFTPSPRVTRDCSNETHNVNNANVIPATTNTALPSPAISSEDPRPSRSLGECPICMDSLGNKAVASTLCGHVFCMGCIKTAFKSNGKKCPTCRKMLKGAGFHQLFL